MRNLALVLVLAVAAVALGQGLGFASNATPVNFRPCTTTGKPPDGGTTAGAHLAEGHYLASCYGANCCICLFDGGTPPAGCNDGGSCWGCTYATSWHCFSQGTTIGITTPRGGQGVSCFSAADAGLDIASQVSLP